MSAARKASALWAARPDAAALDSLPDGVTVTPIDVESGHAASRREGTVHIVTDAALISDGAETRMAASWLCGASSVDAYEVPDDHAVCGKCTLAARLPRSPCVYFAWGDGDELLYVGSTIKAAQRISAHVNGTEWWPEVRRLSFEEFATENEARAAEAQHIWDRPGVYNRKGTKEAASRLTRDLLDGISVDWDGA